MNYNGRFVLAKQRQYVQAQEAMYSLIKKSRQLLLPIDIIFQLFDHTVEPILLYGCEVWGYENCDIIEKLHLEFCRMALHVSKPTSKCMIYGELGRPPLVIQIKQRMANFWIKLAQGKYSKLSVIMFRLLLNLNNNSEYESPWITTVQNILYESGLSNGWHFPNAVNHKWLNNCLKIRLHDEYIQTWSSNVFHNVNCITYRIFKEVFEFESYLTLLPERLRILFTQFRLTNTKLSIEPGRGFNIDRNERYCTLCNRNEIGDEFHINYRFNVTL